MTRFDTGGTVNGSWPWPPEIPPNQPTEPPSRRWPEPPAPILPSWEEPDPQWRKDVADRLLDQRVVLVNGRLDDRLADQISRQLLLLGRTEPERPIELHLSTREADLRPSVALATTIDLIRPRVRAVVSGTLAAPGLAVLCAAAHRVAHRRATIVFSLPRETGEGTAAQLATKADEYELLVTQLIERISSVTGRSDRDVEDDLRSDRLVAAEEARRYGLVDELI